jgi:hypothetical protein
VTTESIALMELIEKHGDKDFLSELGQCTLYRLIELEVDQKVDAGPHERTSRDCRSREIGSGGNLMPS